MPQVARFYSQVVSFYFASLLTFGISATWLQLAKLGCSFTQHGDQPSLRNARIVNDSD
jgi:hypothetical protein